jgi:hypothetical protein
MQRMYIYATNWCSPPIKIILKDFIGTENILVLNDQKCHPKSKKILHLRGYYHQSCPFRDMVGRFIETIFLGF